MDAPSLTDWLHAWIEGTAWYEEMNEDVDMAPWTDFRILTATAGAS
ncbi:hypothetical protein [Streptomyces cellulosae]|uniref:Uncharacterized protein n=1 Tax=Streptomyces cellulosae TaxID=1968 RepID=A0ABW7Y5V0_STRCE